MIYLFKCLKAVWVFLPNFNGLLILSINKSVFPDSLKIANITPTHKKDEPTDKENYRSVNVLPLLSKVFEILLYDQLSKYSEKYLNTLLCGFS